MPSIVRHQMRRLIAGSRGRGRFHRISWAKAENERMNSEHCWLEIKETTMHVEWVHWNFLANYLCSFRASIVVAEPLSLEMYIYTSSQPMMLVPPVFFFFFNHHVIEFNTIQEDLTRTQSPTLAVITFRRNSLPRSGMESPSNNNAFFGSSISRFQVQTSSNGQISQKKSTSLAKD